MVGWVTGYEDRETGTRTPTPSPRNHMGIRAGNWQTWGGGGQVYPFLNISNKLEYSENIPGLTVCL